MVTTVATPLPSSTVPRLPRMATGRLMVEVAVVDAREELDVRRSGGIADERRELLERVRDGGAGERLAVTRSDLRGRPGDVRALGHGDLRRAGRSREAHAEHHDGRGDEHEGKGTRAAVGAAHAVFLSGSTMRRGQTVLQVPA